MMAAAYAQPPALVARWFADHEHEAQQSATATGPAAAVAPPPGTADQIHASTSSGLERQQGDSLSLASSRSSSSNGGLRQSGVFEPVRRMEAEQRGAGVALVFLPVLFWLIFLRGRVPVVALALGRRRHDHRMNLWQWTMPLELPAAAFEHNHSGQPPGTPPSSGLQWSGGCSGAGSEDEQVRPYMPIVFQADAVDHAPRTILYALWPLLPAARALWAS